MTGALLVLYLMVALIVARSLANHMLSPDDEVEDIVRGGMCVVLAGFVWPALLVLAAVAFVALPPDVRRALMGTQASGAEPER